MYTQTDPYKYRTRFVDQYSDQLNQLIERIERKDPDYILAISRSGPRLLELLSKEGMFSDSFPVVSEKALDFIPSHQFEESHVVVFDDVTNTGKTIAQTQLELDAKFNPERIDPLTFGFDRDTSHVEKADVEPQLLFDSSKRHESIKNITQSFCILNKPYDVDHPIIYSEFSPAEFGELKKSEQMFDLTTIQQSRLGLHRYTYFPNGESSFNNVIQNILSEVETFIDIEKIRIYYDQNSEQLTTVPIYSFPIREETVKKGNIFDEKVPNRLRNCFDAIDRQLDDVADSRDELASFSNLYKSKRAMTKYRFSWYLVNYLYGVFSHQSDNNLLPELNSPHEFLDICDLSYIFGPDISELLVEVFDSNFNETKEFIEKASDSQTDAGGLRKRSQDARLEPDKNQQKVIAELEDYIRNNTLENMTYSDQLSTIFEGSELVIESDSVQVSEDNQPNKQGFGADRLERQTGLNFSQLLSSLQRADIEMSEKDRQGYSLALDFLIDTGVAIPKFYDKEDSEWLERAYRHGEGALNRMGYNFVIDSVFKGLYKYIDDDTVNRITAEKIGVMLTERLHNGRYWGEHTTSSIYDFLQRSNMSRELKISKEYHRHGRVVLHDFNTSDRSFFVQWCELNNILKDAGDDRGVRRHRGWKPDHRDDISHIRSTISDSKVQALENLAILVYEIDKELDDSSQSDYVTALTSCRDKQSYLNSLQAELRLFFSEDNWCITPSIERLDEIHDDCDSIDTNLLVDRDLAWLAADIENILTELNAAHEAINGLDKKKRLRHLMEDNRLISEVRDYFKHEVNPDKRRNYKRDLKPYLDNIERIKEYRGSGLKTAINNIEEKTEVFGDVCLYFSTALRASLEIIAKISENKSNVREELNEMYDAVENFNDTITSHSDLLYSALELGNIPMIDLDKVQLGFIQNRNYESAQIQDTNTAVILVQDLISQYLTIYDEVRTIYNQYFEDHEWSSTVDDLFLQTNSAEVEANWVVWYDIKDSSDPSNSENTHRLKQSIEDEIEKIANECGDGKFRYSDDDEKHIFVRDEQNVQTYVRTIVNTAHKETMTVRIGICSLPSERLEVTKRKMRSNEGHVRGPRVGNVLDKETEADEAHYISMSRSVTEESDIEDNLIEKFSVSGHYSVEKLCEDEVHRKDSDVVIPVHVYEIR